MEGAGGTVRDVRYWDRPGPGNTAATVELSVRRARELGLHRLVVASNTGTTAQALRRAADKDMRIVCVTHSVGFREPGVDEMPREARQELAAAGVEVLTTTHFLAGVDRALRVMQGGFHAADVVAMSLRMLGQGLKVAVEISVMATDAGLLRPGEEAVAIGGTNRGADTAIVVRPTHGQSFFDTRVVELICMPRG